MSKYTQFLISGNYSEFLFFSIKLKDGSVSRFEFKRHSQRTTESKKGDLNLNCTFVSRLSGNHPLLQWQQAARDRVTRSMRTNKLRVERLLMVSLVGVIVLTLLRVRSNRLVL